MLMENAKSCTRRGRFQLNLFNDLFTVRYAASELWTFLRYAPHKNGVCIWCLRERECSAFGSSELTDDLEATFCLKCQNGMFQP